MKSCPNCQRAYHESQAACPLDDGVLVDSDAPCPAGVGRVLGNYQLVALLGTGGMGSIYVGAHTLLNRHVAVKVLRPELEKRKETIARFFDEARTINRLQHPNIVESIDLVEDVVDGAYCVLELLRGKSLVTRLARGPVALESALRIGAQIGDALSAVHELGIVHRDLKPENLILIERDDRDDFVKLIDFGVAKVADDSGMIAVGTAAYMAPEQAAGEKVDHRADIYSLGVVLFEMVTGHHPYPSASDNEYILAHAEDPVPRPSRIAAGLPKSLDAVIMRCLAKRADHRYASAAEVAAALRAIAPARARSGAWKWAAIALVIAGGGASAFFVMGSSSQSAPVPARPAPHVSVPDPIPIPAVTLHFASNPPGATVTRDGESVPLGTTPFTATLPIAGFRATFELAGYEPKQILVDGDVSIALVKLAAPAASPAQAPAKKKQKKVQREGVMDPFAK